MERSDNQDLPGMRIAPPLIFLVLLGVGLLLHSTTPLDLSLPFAARVISAALLFPMAGILAFGAVRVMHREKTPFNPDRPTTALCSSGVFCISRNPMYLSLVLLLLSIGLVISSLWLLMLTPLLLMAFDRLAVKPEEVYLTKKFGDAYLEYKRRVRRWL